MRPNRLALTCLALFGILALAGGARAQTTLPDPPIGCGASLAPGGDGGSAPATPALQLGGGPFGIAAPQLVAAAVARWWPLAAPALAPATAVPVRPLRVATLRPAGRRTVR